MQNVLISPPRQSVLNLPPPPPLSHPGIPSKVHVPKAPHTTAAKGCCAACPPGLLLPLRCPQHGGTHRCGSSYGSGQTRQGTGGQMPASPALPHQRPPATSLHPNAASASPQNPPAEAWVALLPSHLHSCLHTCTSTVCWDSPSCWHHSPLRMLWGQLPFACPPVSPPGSTPWPRVPRRERVLPSTLLAVPVHLSLQIWVVRPSHPCPFCICCTTQVDGFSWFLSFFSPSPPWNTFKGFLKQEKPERASRQKNASGRA